MNTTPLQHSADRLMTRALLGERAKGSDSVEFYSTLVERAQERAATALLSGDATKAREWINYSQAGLEMLGRRDDA